ncbi:AMP-binding protein [Algoriphagus terrigena]|uniref:AMP-binding protein n=1 Tax=Algoriphagus terrigena TaxID=344884 RepID=UPI00041FD64F|nr:AMP-binding protein [Algoriphagus terrigena]
MFQLHFDNQVFSDLSDFERDLEALPDFAKAAFTFCHAWLSGAKTFVQQTSGSTGVPKKIEVTREQMLASSIATGAFFNANESTQLLCCLSPEYIAGKMMLVRAMVWDCPIWLVEPSGIQLDAISFVPDFVAMVPLQVEKAIENPPSVATLRGVKHLIIGGASISKKLKSKLVVNSIEAWQSYGMTETVSHIALAKITQGDLLYQTLPGVEIGQDGRGALWVKSPMSRTEKIQTNDLVDLKSENGFLWLGRADFVVNSGGIKLHPELLESKAESVIQEFFPGSRFFFFGEFDEKLGQKLVLILENEPNLETSKKLTVSLVNNLSRFEVPKEVYFSREFVLTPNGKINRSQTFENL